MERYFGWIPQPYDNRDFKLRLPNVKPLPFVDLSQFSPPAYNQYALGSCTGQAIAGAYEMEMKKRGKEIFTPSRLAIYYMERELEGTINEDAGAYIRDGMKVCNKYGVFPEAEWEYDISKFKIKPSQACYDHALNHQVLEYLAVSPSLVSVKIALTLGYSVIFGFLVYSNFMDVGSDGIMSMPKGTQEGGHAVRFIGYDDKTGYFRVVNSWGQQWGNNGHFFMPYDYLNYCNDLWIIQIIE